MTDMREQNQALELLERTLDVFGSDSARWPAGVKTKLTPLMNNSVDARRKIAEAVALDKVLSNAPVISLARQSELADQIVAKALRQPRQIAVSDQPVRSIARPPMASRFKTWRQNSIVGGALAASLMIGILSGQNSTVGSFSEAMIAGVDATDVSAQQIAQTDELVTFYEEDLL